jgi:hypothetical protein|tara:strand:+ start:9587 stop:10069 length:483 start_codon:yes stop_codon:yes gene_type:complete
MVEEKNTTATDRSPRSAESREKKTRLKPWSPPSLLDAPTPPEGYVYRWIRESMVGQQDQANMSKRLREGWEPVMAKSHPDFEAPSIEDGKHAGVIGVGGLILAKMPIETVEQRRAYYAKVANDQMEAVDNNLMRESNPVMPIEKPNRQSNVTFGSGGSKN